MRTRKLKGLGMLVGTAVLAFLITADAWKQHGRDADFRTFFVWFVVIGISLTMAYESGRKDGRDEHQ